jgi:tetrahydromethanopterin S-methyltransferase subunit C
MNDNNKYGTISIIFAIIAIIISWNKNYFIASIIVGAIAIAFAYLSFYIKQIKENTKNINEMKKELETEKRLIKIENKLNL